MTSPGHGFEQHVGDQEPSRERRAAGGATTAGSEGHQASAARIAIRQVTATYPACPVPKSSLRKASIEGISVPAAHAKATIQVLGQPGSPTGSARERARLRLGLQPGEVAANALAERGGGAPAEFLGGPLVRDHRTAGVAASPACGRSVSPTRSETTSASSRIVTVSSPARL